MCGRGCLGENLNLLSAVIANTISSKMDIDDISLLAILFSAIGDSLGVIAAARTVTKLDEKFDKKLSNNKTT